MFIGIFDVWYRFCQQFGDRFCYWNWTQVLSANRKLSLALKRQNHVVLSCDWAFFLLSWVIFKLSTFPEDLNRRSSAIILCVSKSVAIRWSGQVEKTITPRHNLIRGIPVFQILWPELETPTQTVVFLACLLLHVRYIRICRSGLFCFCESEVF